jgi:hypothetical protein
MSTGVFTVVAKAVPSAVNSATGQSAMSLPRPITMR